MTKSKFIKVNIDGFGHYDTINYPVGSKMDDVFKFCRFFAKVINEYPKDNKEVRFIVMGSSGAILGGIVSSMLECKSTISHIKKDGEQSHSHSINYDTYGKNYFNVIIDDFIVSGSTVNTIYNKTLKKCLDDYTTLDIDMLMVSGLVHLPLLCFIPKVIVSSSLDGQYIDTVIENHTKAKVVLREEEIKKKIETSYFGSF